MMKKRIVFVNVAIILAIMAFVVIYSSRETRSVLQAQVENFEATTLAMERVTENYLQGEQGICDVWAHYINSREMTLEEAVAAYGSYPHG